MIPQTYIQDLLNRVDIVDIVGRYVQLKKGGANFMGLCPFHSEKSPSFTVSPTKQFYHCFGCGAHGTALGFLMEHSGAGFVEAVEDLSREVGMTVPERTDNLTPQQRQQHTQQQLALSDIMTQASAFYRKQLAGNQPAIDYLKSRGLNGTVARDFGLGYAPEGWDSLKQVFTQYDMPELVEAGLLIQRDEEGQNSKRYDRFRHRIMFPIRSIKGQVIGFGGRVMDGGEPKYLNSPDTPLFQKGNELYGLFEARLAIREAGYVLVTEGYMDVVALAQLGFAQSVATLGTACTGVHLQKLVRHTDRIIFSFDGDAAGRRAARRALEASLPYADEEKTIQFLFLPAQHDPDSFIRANGTDAFAAEIRHAMPLSEFLLQEAKTDCDLGTAEGRARVQHNAKPMLQAMPPSGLRLQIVRALATETNSTPSELETLFALEKPVARANIPPPRVKREPPAGVERHVIRILIGQPRLIHDFGGHAEQLFELVAPHQRDTILELQQAAQDIGSNINFAGLIQHLSSQSSSALNSLIADIARQEPDTEENARMELIGALMQLDMLGIKRQIDALAASGLSTPESQQSYRDLMQKQILLKQQMGKHGA